MGATGPSLVLFFYFFFLCVKIHQLTQRLAEIQPEATRAEDLENELMTTRERLSTLTVQHSELRGVSQATEQQLRQLTKRLTEMEEALRERDSLLQQQQAAHQRLAQVEEVFRDAEATKQRAAILEEEHRVLQAKLMSLQEAREKTRQTAVRYREERNQLRKQLAHANLTTREAMMNPIVLQHDAAPQDQFAPSVSHHTADVHLRHDIKTGDFPLRSASQAPVSAPMPSAYMSAPTTAAAPHRTSSGHDGHREKHHRRSLTGDQRWTPSRSSTGEPIHSTDFRSATHTLATDARPGHHVLVPHDVGASSEVHLSRQDAFVFDSVAGSRLQANDFVQVKRKGGETQLGKVMYVGPLVGKEGEYVGLELVLQGEKAWAGCVCVCVCVCVCTRACVRVYVCAHSRA